MKDVRKGMKCDFAVIEKKLEGTVEGRLWLHH